MMVETFIRWLGGLLAYGTLGVVLYGLWRGMQRQPGRTTGQMGRYLRSPWFYLVTSALFLGLCVLGWKPLPAAVSPTARSWMLAIGSLLYFPGMLLVLWARLALGKNYFASTGLGVQLFADHQLITGGPFAILRHPMYAGIILAAFGSLLLYVTWTTLFLACFAPLISVRARREEAALAAEFGEQWQAYCQRVPMWIPRLSRRKTMTGDVRTTIPDLQGVARTLLVPLACRAIESTRPDAILHDPRAVALYNTLGGSREFLLGMSEHDRLFTVMRMRQFDTFARAFLAQNPGGLVVDIGCGLDTRFYRLDDGQMNWFGLDLPEVINLRQQWLPDANRCKCIAKSMFDLEWLDEVQQINKPVIFLAEGVFSYFSTREVKPMLTAMAERFPAGELVFDAMAPFVMWLHKGSSVLKRSGAQVHWDAKNPAELEAWGLCLLERWGYFDKPEPRLGAASLMRFIPPLANTVYVLRYRLSN